MTAIDVFSKIAFARVYQFPSSFTKYFEKACQYLGIEHYFSRTRTPKDLAVLERFNRILKEEFLNLGNFHPDPEVFNPKLGQWLEEFNFKRPHQALAYQTPIEFACQNAKVSKMYSSCTRS